MAERRVLSLIIDLKDKASSALKGTFGRIGSAVQSVTRVLAQAAIAVGGYALATAKLTERGGQVLNVQRAFGRVAGDVDTALLKLRESSSGLISNYELMVGLNRAVTLGAARNVEDYGKLAETGLTLGRALGVDAAFAVESLTLGIGRQSRMILDNLGLIVSVEEANEKYAESIGKTVEQLSQAESLEAFRIAALTAAEEKIAELGGVTLNTADSLGQMKTAFANLKDEVAKFLAESDDLKIAFAEGANIVETLIIALETRDAETIKKAFTIVGQIAGAAFGLAFFRAAQGILQPILQPEWLPDWMVGGEQRAGGVFGLIKRAADEAEASINPLFDALGALRREMGVDEGRDAGAIGLDIGLTARQVTASRNQLRAMEARQAALVAERKRVDEGFGAASRLARLAELDREIEAGTLAIGDQIQHIGDLDASLRRLSQAYTEAQRAAAGAAGAGVGGDPEAVEATLREIVLAERERVELLFEGHELGTLTLEEHVELLAAYERINQVLREGNLTIEERIALTEAQQALTGAPLSPTRVNAPFRFGAPDPRPVGRPTEIQGEDSLGNVRESLMEILDLEREIEDVTAGSLVTAFNGFGSAVEASMAAAVTGSESAGEAFAGAMLGALASVARGYAEFYMAQAMAELAKGPFGNPAGFVAAAAAMYAVAGTVGGMSRSMGGSGSASGGSKSRLEGSARGDATIVIQGGFLDMSDPRQADAFAKALSDLSGRRVKVIGRRG